MSVCALRSARDSCVTRRPHTGSRARSRLVLHDLMRAAGFPSPPSVARVSSFWGRTSRGTREHTPSAPMCAPWAETQISLCRARPRPRCPARIVRDRTAGPNSQPLIRSLAPHRPRRRTWGEDAHVGLEMTACSPSPPAPSLAPQPPPPHRGARSPPVRADERRWKGEARRTRFVSRRTWGEDAHVGLEMTARSPSPSTASP